ncbi:MAG: ABC transporter substrate-binding protein [Synergistaceae bacterium]|nr:ABC transporter substrate-binding protein [Synergistaceae bacterium]
MVSPRGASADERIDIDNIRGPKIEELAMLIISNPDAQIMAAEAGELDIVSDIARPSDIDLLSANKNLQMSLARGMHAFFLLLNNRAAPWDDKDVRRAAAMAIDRGSIVRMIFSGYCEPINSWLPPVSPWALANSTEDIYDPADAKELLKKKGYSWDLAGMLVAPDGKRLPTMKLLTPLARVAPTTAELAELIADSLKAVGFPAEVDPIDFSTMIARLDRKDYSLAVLAWSMGRNPDSLYSFYHSDMDVEGGYNMAGIRDARLDNALAELRYAPDRSAAEIASDEAQRLLLELMPSVPIYSRISVAAISGKWKNIFTTDKMTADNMWTLLTAEPKDGKMRPLTMLLPEEPRNLNPFTASSAYSWQVLGMIYETMLSTNPYTLENMPGLAASWDINTAGEGKSRHTELTFKIRRGLRWNDGSPLTARDIKASIDFIHKNKIPRFFDSVKNIRSVETPDDYTLRVVMEGVSYWYLDNVAGIPALPQKVVADIKDWQSWDPLSTKNAGGPRGLVGSGPFMLKSYKPGEYVMMKRNPHYRLLGGGTR